MANTQLWSPDKDQPFSIAGRTIDPPRRTIEYNGQTTTVEPRVMALLLSLAESPTVPVRRDALIDAVWPGSPGAESSLSNAVSLLRRALDDSNDDERLIKTVPKFGYCLTRPAEPMTFAASEAQPARTYRPRILTLAVVTTIALGTAAFIAQSPRHTDEPSAAGVDAAQTEESSRAFIAVAPIDAPAEYAALAHVLTRDATARLAQLRRFRVADVSEAYQVAGGTLLADLTIRATLEETDDGLRLTARWFASDLEAAISVRQFNAGPGAVLALRGDWLEAVVVETALAIATESETRLDANSVVADASTDDVPWLTAPTSNVAAFDAYSSAIWYTNQYRADLMLEAIREFERAVELDPEFAIAWADLGTAYLMAGSHQGAIEPATAQLKARDALLRALTLAPTLSDAHNALADYYNCIERNPLLAQRAFDSTFAIEPEYASAGYTRLLLLHHSPAAAKERIRRNLARFPDSLSWKLIAAQHLLAVGENAAAFELADEALAIAPAMFEARLTKAKTLSVSDRHAEALTILDTLLEEFPGSARLNAHRVIALARAGRSADAAALLKDTLENDPTARRTHLAMAYAWTGNADAAFGLLEQALAEREFGLCYVAVEPVYEPLRSDPRFARLVQRMRGAELN